MGRYEDVIEPLTFQALLKQTGPAIMPWSSGSNGICPPDPADPFKEKPPILSPNGLRGGGFGDEREERQVEATLMQATKGKDESMLAMSKEDRGVEVGTHFPLSACQKRKEL